MEAIREDLRVVERALTSASARQVEASRERLESALDGIGHLERITKSQPLAVYKSSSLRLELVSLGKRIREVRRLAMEGESFCRGLNEWFRPPGDAYTAAGCSREHNQEGTLVAQG
jgi:hypothetical protein